MWKRRITLTPTLVDQLQEMTRRSEHVKDSCIKFLCDCRDFNMGVLNLAINVVWRF